MYQSNPTEPDSNTKAQVPFKISPEDQKVLQECNRESFYKRCLPFSVGFGGITYLAVKSGHLNGHVSYGATPKVMAAVFLGYFVGKLSYQQICAEKLMAIPNSPMGAMLRARRQKGGGGVFQDSQLKARLKPSNEPKHNVDYGCPSRLTMEMPGYSMPDNSFQDKYRDDISPRTFTDLDTDRPYNKGLDDSFRLNVDSPQRTEDFILPPQAATPNSYEEMRRRNREDFERKTKSFRSQSVPEEQPRQYQPFQPTPGSGPETFDRYKPTNSYGDIFEK